MNSRSSRGPPRHDATAGRVRRQVAILGRPGGRPPLSVSCRCAPATRSPVPRMPAVHRRGHATHQRGPCPGRRVARPVYRRRSCSSYRPSSDVPGAGTGPVTAPTIVSPVHAPCACAEPAPGPAETVDPLEHQALCPGGRPGHPSAGHVRVGDRRAQVHGTLGRRSANCSSDWARRGPHGQGIVPVPDCRRRSNATKCARHSSSALRCGEVHRCLRFACHGAFCGVPPIPRTFGVGAGP